MATAGNLKKKRALVIRLSSLGDVVLTTAALERLRHDYEEVHYLTTPEYAGWLDGHPGITHIWTYEKSTGFAGWMKMGNVLRTRQWDAVFDLHLSLRTRLARFFWKLKTEKWVSLPKPYFKRLGLFIFKSRWPESLAPIPYRELFALTVGGTGDEPTSLENLVKGSKGAPEPQIGVMPSSRWQGKEPPLTLIYEWFIANGSGKKAVIFGTEKDQASKKLLEFFEKKNIPAVSKIGTNRDELIQTILKCERVVGADTGLIHVAEALGVTVHVWYGPTSPKLGFAPYLEESTYSEPTSFCSPCSKDGRKCYRMGQAYQCWLERA